MEKETKQIIVNRPTKYKVKQRESKHACNVMLTEANRDLIKSKGFTTVSTFVNYCIKHIDKLP